MTVIALEEHFLSAEAAALFTGHDVSRPNITQRLLDLGDGRLAAMDDAGIDMQVLSLSAPATQKMAAATAIRIAKAANDGLHATILAHPDRFAGFAALPTPDPQAAAAELERCVTQLGFKGAMIHGLTNGVFIDDKRFWPIFQAAEALDVPIYLHPSTPHGAVVDAYYADYLADFPSIIRAGWGFTVETATAAIRLILSGVFDVHPKLKIILGHLGEGLPFLLWRIDHALSRAGNRALSFRTVFCNHFHLTTSGNFSDPALICSIMEIGIDHILFSVDWPFVENKPAVEWMSHVPLCAEDRTKILSGNARRLLRL